MKKEKNKLFEKLEKDGLLEPLIEGSKKKYYSEFAYELVNYSTKKYKVINNTLLLSIISIIFLLISGLLLNLPKEFYLLCALITIATFIFLLSPLHFIFFRRYIINNKQTIEYDLLINNKHQFLYSMEDIIEKVFIIPDKILMFVHRNKELFNFYYRGEKKTVIVIKLKEGYTLNQHSSKLFNWLFLVLPENNKINEHTWFNQFKSGKRLFTCGIGHGKEKVTIIENFIVKDLWYPYGCFIEKQNIIPEEKNAFSFKKK